MEAPESDKLDVLIVEDSPTQAEQLRYILEKNGCNARIAKDGKEALFILDTAEPAVIFTDIVMPEMDGYELCKQIKSDDRLKKIPVILVTVLADVKDVARALECGADNYITKPYEEEFLLSRIEDLAAYQDVQPSAASDVPLEVTIDGQTFKITPKRMQTMTILLSTYELAIKRNQELVQANNEMEMRVADRTVELHEVNEELKAFSYSVSHDLRAPLRAISGFSLLLEEHGVDEVGRIHLQRVRKAADHMEELIEDLLRLSTVTSMDMNREEVDLSGLVGCIFTELAEAHPQRDVETVIQPGVTAKGDAHLLRICLENLLGNAWKFTSKRRQARIEFSTARFGGERAFCVRDDGSGFDNKYKDKLFTAFQRLHADSDFPGTGIGLATVKRIIVRHQGRVWGEGELGKGATFYFII